MFNEILIANIDSPFPWHSGRKFDRLMEIAHVQDVSAVVANGQIPMAYPNQMKNK